MHYVFEYMCHGSLADVASDLDVAIGWDGSLQFLIDASAGLQYLHSQTTPVIHDQISSDSFLVDKNWRVKVDKYSVSNMDDKLSKKYAKPNLWSAPEVCSEPDAHRGGSTVAYSFALVMYHVFSRVAPFNRKFDESFVTKLLEGRRPGLTKISSDKCKKLIKDCWQPEANKRPTLESINNQLRVIKAEGPARILLDETNAEWYQKSQTVFAYRSKDPVTIVKIWGKSVGLAGSFVLDGGEDDVYLLQEEVFHATYEPFKG